ncbi:MAG: hypothetical protein J6L83_07980 [Clostridia bacterium]|nr:hypothetical protein [Clostridia bacterium]
MEDISLVKIDTITPDDGYDYFFAYYDLQPYDKESKIHLTHRVKFHDRIPTAEDICEVGYITLCDKVFHKVAKTRAWNFQQGAQLQWFDDESIFYNDFRNGEFCGVIKNIFTGAEREICKPLANLSADRRWGLSINFPRVWDFRAGYGYCNYRDRFFDEKAPEEDGIFLVDIENNIAKLIIDYATLREAFPQKPHCDHKLVVNHITFNPSSSRFLFLLRDFPEEGSTWGTMLITANRDGSEMRKLTDYTGNSHYNWKNDHEIMIYAQLPEWGIYFIDDETGERVKLDDADINFGDTHCNYHPDRTCFIGDGYPWPDPLRRRIWMYDFESERSVMVAQIYADPDFYGDYRCDLHDRFNRDGTLVSFDALGEGNRRICQFKFDKKQILEKALQKK